MIPAMSVTSTTGATVAANTSPVVIPDVLGSAIPENNSRIFYASLHFYILYSDKTQNGEKCKAYHHHL